MTTHRRSRLLLAGLYALLLVASPGLSWQKTYNCLASGAVGLSECCQEWPPEPGRPLEPRMVAGEEACDCCELILSRQIPAESLSRMTGSDNGPELAQAPSASPAHLAHPRPAVPPPAPLRPPPCAGPNLRLLHASFLF